MRFLIIGVIIVLAVGAGFLVMQMAQPEPQVETVVEPTPQVEAVNVLVARQPISAGTVITEAMLDQQPWPSHLVLDGFIQSGKEGSNLVGMVARSDFQAQEPMNRAKIADPKDANFIAAALPEGMRAVTLQIDAISGVAGYVYPGDRIDILLAHNITASGQNSRAISGSEASYAQTILANIKVLALDIRGANVPPAEGQAPPAPMPTNITLEVTPEQAQAIRLAERNGTISLALRSLRDIESKATVAATSVDDLTGAQQGSGDARVVIVRGVQADMAAAQYNMGAR